MEAATTSARTAPPPTKKRMTDRAKAERKLAWLLCAPAVIAMLLVTGYPIAYAFYLSLQKFDLRFPDDKEFVGLSNYADVLSSSTWWSDLLTTVIITVISVSIELVLGMLIALVMHRAIFGRGPVRAAILIPYGIRTVVAFRIFDNIFIIQPGGALGTESVSILGYNVLINRVNLGLGSAISILIFICVILIAVLFVKGLGTSTAQQRGET